LLFIYKEFLRYFYVISGMRN